MIKKISKIVSWILLILTVGSIVLMLWPPQGATAESDPSAASSFDRKLAELAAAHQRGEASEARLTEAEVNSKAQQLFAGAPAAGLTSLSGVAVHFEQDQLACVLKIKFLGLSLYITLGAKPAIREGRLEFEVMDVELGRMPLPASPVSEALKEKLRSAQGQEMLAMPDFITGLRVENGELVIESK